MDRKSKTIFQLDSPFTAASWPHIVPQDQDTILEILCNTLSPIGQYRASHVVRSKGKRDKKRKRANEKLGKDVLKEAIVPPPPDITSFIVVGLNAVTRSLERLSKKGKPSTAPLANATKSSLDGSSNEKDGLTVEPKVSSDNKHLAPVDAQFSAIFVPRSSQPPILHSHLPQLVATASLAYPDSSPIRLVSLPKGVRVNSVQLWDSPASLSLVYWREHRTANPL